MGLGGSNLQILTPDMDHMAGNCQNYWFLSKTHHVEKSVPQIYKSPRALGLNENTLQWIGLKGDWDFLPVMETEIWNKIDHENSKV